MQRPRAKAPTLVPGFVAVPCPAERANGLHYALRQERQPFPRITAHWISALFGRKQQVNGKDKMNMRPLYDFKLRVLLAGTFLSASLVCVLLATNPKFDHCVDSYLDNYNACISKLNPDGSYKYSVSYCSKNARLVFEQCLRRNNVKIPNKGTLPPLPTRPAKPPRPVANQSPTPSPSPTTSTIYSKPKATVSPH